MKTYEFSLISQKFVVESFIDLGSPNMMFFSFSFFFEYLIPKIQPFSRSSIPAFRNFENQSLLTPSSSNNLEFIFFKINTIIKDLTPNLRPLTTIPKTIYTFLQYLCFQTKIIRYNIYQEIRKKTAISKDIMIPNNFNNLLNQDQLPLSYRNPINFANFSSVSPSLAFDHQKIKFQQKNQNLYNFSERRKQNNDQSQSPEYDLFEIEKKRKKQKYKRSTNNSHKKFISALRRLFYAVISTRQKEQFQTKYSKFRSCRTFFFIILAYMKFRFSSKLLNSVRVSFINQMKIKINQYQEEINRTKNMNLKNFRQQEIIDIKYSIKSCNEYFQGNTRQAIQCMYKKDKSTVIKRQHYESALRSVHSIEKQLNQNPRSPLESPYVEDFSHSSDREKVERKVIKREIRENQLQQFALEKQEPFDYGFGFNPMSNNFGPSKKDVRITDATQNAEIQTPVSQSQREFFPQREVLFPPLLEAIPYINYDPFLPPFRYKRQTRYKIDVREDFFGPGNYGFPKFYDRRPSISRYSLGNSFPEYFRAKV